MQRMNWRSGIGLPPGPAAGRHRGEIWWQRDLDFAIDPTDSPDFIVRPSVTAQLHADGFAIFARGRGTGRLYFDASYSKLRIATSGDHESSRVRLLRIFRRDHRQAHQQLPSLRSPRC